VNQYFLFSFGFVINFILNWTRKVVRSMNKFIFTIILLLGFSFASTGEGEPISVVDAHYDALDVDSGEIIIAAAGKKKEKSPLRKRYLKRKRKLRNPAQGK